MHRRPLHVSERLRPVLVRGLVLVTLATALVAVARSDTLHRELMDVLAIAEGIIAAHPVAGPVAFVGLSALAALFAAVSSAVLVPAAIVAWGAVPTALMLWLGWALGGCIAYAIAHRFGMRVLRWLVPSATLGRYQRWLDREPPFASVLLVQLTLPSEVAGYLLGLARCPPPRYLATVLLGELPYAIGTVLLGLGFVERDALTLVGVGLVGAVALLVVARAVKRRHLGVSQAPDAGDGTPSPADTHGPRAAASPRRTADRAT